MLVSRFPYRFPDRERDHVSEQIWLERDRCIFCQRCVEFVRDRSHRQEDLQHQPPRQRMRASRSTPNCANAMPTEQVRYAVEICPVGAILEKRVGYDDPDRPAQVRSRIGPRPGSRPGRRMTDAMTDEIERRTNCPRPAMDPELSAASAPSKINVSMISLCGCWGCTLSFLDMDERILPLLDKVTILRSSLTDIKTNPRALRDRLHRGRGRERGQHRDAAALPGELRHPDLGRRLRGLGRRPGDAQRLRVEGLPGRGVRQLADRGSRCRTRRAAAHPDIPRSSPPRCTPATKWSRWTTSFPGAHRTPDAIFTVFDDLINGRPVALAPLAQSLRLTRRGLA